MSYKQRQREKQPLEIGQQFPLTIKRLGINGEGVGFFKRQAVFVPGALPGEEVVAQVIEVKRGFALAEMIRIRIKSPERVKPPCPVYDDCGGCQLQHLSYKGQLEQKRDIIIQALERHSSLDVSKVDVRPTIGMENPWNYRNKSQLQVGRKGKKIIAGLYSLNSHDLVDLTHCNVQNEHINKVTNTMKHIIQALDIQPYEERRRVGYIRTIVTRIGLQTGQIQLTIVAASRKIPHLRELTQMVKEKLPQVTSLMLNVNNEDTSIIFGNDTLHLTGEEIIEERLGNFEFELSPRAFFQLNPEQTVKLYDEAKKAAALTGKQKLVDAYCGVGTIGLWLSEGAAEIRGMDITDEAIYDARVNAERYNVNAIYEIGKAEEWLPRWVEEGWRPDVVVVDPPRTGCDQAFLNTLLDVRPKRFVYVSCNPSTLAKDIAFISKYYKVEYIQPLDMFPQTAQVESIVKLTLK